MKITKRYNNCKSSRSKNVDVKFLVGVHHDFSSQGRTVATDNGWSQPTVGSDTKTFEVKPGYEGRVSVQAYDFATSLSYDVVTYLVDASGKRTQLSRTSHSENFKMTVYGEYYGTVSNRCSVP